MFPVRRCRGVPSNDATSSFVFTTVLMLSVLVDPLSAFIFPLHPLHLFGDDGGALINPFVFGSNNNNLGQGLLELQSRLTALETNVRSGALGGCESGVIGPLNSAQSTGTITFRKPFLAPPAITLALSDLTTLDPSVVTGLTIRPVTITSATASVQVTPENNNVATVFVSYMACPSRASPAVSPSDVMG